MLKEIIGMPASRKGKFIFILISASFLIMFIIWLTDKELVFFGEKDKLIKNKDNKQASSNAIFESKLIDVHNIESQPLQTKFEEDEGKVMNLGIQYEPETAKAEHQKPDGKPSLMEYGEIIQSRIKKLQNPPNCTTAKKLYCLKSKHCGLGCLVSHFLPCLYLGYFTKRTIILDSDNQMLKHAGGFDRWLYPASLCGRKDIDLRSALDLRSGKENVLGMGKVNNSHPLWYWSIVHNDSPNLAAIRLYNGFYRTLPDDFAIVKEYTRQPESWFAGQFVKYYFGRWRPDVEETIKQKAEAIGYKHPVVGLQVRQPVDYRHKIGIPLDQYITALDDYFDFHYPDLKERRVFLATDNSEPFEYFISVNSRYTFVYQSSDVASQARDMRHSQTNDSMLGLLVDMYLLVNADGMITTLNSNFGVMLYQLRMASWDRDVVDTTKSIEDNLEWVLCLNFDRERAMLLVIKDFSSEGPQDLNLKVGDFVIDPLMYYNWDSMSPLLVYSRGKKFGTNETGRYPVSYVVRYPEDSLRYIIPEDLLTWEDK